MYLLGIDAGGSKTTFALARADSSAFDRAPEIVARSRSGTLKLGSVSEDQARENFRLGLSQALADARSSALEITRCAIGFSGLSRPDLVTALRRITGEQLPSTDVHIYGDHHIAHRAAFSDGVGVIVIAGTGSIAYARNSQGKESRAGGRGPVISDQGSGTWIGREAAAAAVAEFDRAGSSPLLDAILTEWKLADLNALIARANSCAPSEFAALFPVVDRLAQPPSHATLSASPSLAHAAASYELTSTKGVASDIFMNAAIELVCLALVAATQDDLRTLPFAFSGGVIDASEKLRRWIEIILAKFGTLTNVRLGGIDPLLGALALARHPMDYKL